MPKGKQLTEKERRKITAYRDSGMTMRCIASKIDHGTTVAHNFLALRSKYGKKKRSGRKPILTKRGIRGIKNLAVNKSVSPGQIKVELGLGEFTRRVQQILHAGQHLTYGKRQAQPNLLSRHKLARLKFAEKYQFWDEEWQKVIFSDEKKFNSDGPDRCQFHWRDKRRKIQTRNARNFGGGSLMIWAAFNCHGKSPICVISTKMNAQKYIELLDDILVDSGDDLFGEDTIFQQVNAAVHSAKLTKTFLLSRSIPILGWPAASPNLNPIGNVWGLLANRVYANGRQFETVKHLKQAIQCEWNKIDKTYLNNLIDSMPRHQHVILNSGGSTNY